jgi:hypothetical protein
MRQKCTSLTCIDLPKAFDCINHSILKTKLAELGIERNFQNLLYSYLSDRQQLVRVNLTDSAILTLGAGTPQGGVLSGLLFNIYINSILALDLHGRQFLYCDDNSLVNSAEDPLSLKQQIESDLSSISKWLNLHFLSPNRDETKYLTFHYSKRAFNYISLDLRISFDNLVIERVESVKVLGLIIDSRLDFKNHIQAIHKRIIPFIFAVKRIRNHLSDKVALSLYYAYVNSHFTYMSTVWSASANELMLSIEILQRKVLRIVLRKDWYCSSSELYSQSILPVSIEARIATLLYVFKIQHSLIKNNVPLALIVDRHAFNTRSRNVFALTRCQTMHAMQNIFYRGLHEFNQLPESIRSFHSIALFKNRLREFFFERL